MQRYLLFTLFLSICFAFESFERSSFPKRSGDIIVIPENIQDDSFLVLLDSHKVENTKENNAVHETNVANLISNLVGGPIVNAELSLDESNTLGHSLFNKAKANLIVFVDGVGSDDLTSFSQMKIAQQGQKLQLHRVAYPQDSIATLTTLITGQTPSVHGIVNAAWGNRDDYEVAYTESAGARIFNLNDQMTQTFEGQPLIISASSNFQMTSAMGVNSRNFFGNNFNLFWNDRRNCFDSVHFGNTFGLNVSREQIMNDVQTPLSFEDSKEEFLFVAELAFLENMVKQLENAHFSPLVGDKVPDLFAFSFSSLKNIKSHSDSKFGEAVELLDKTLVEVVSKLNLLYSGKVTAEVVFMGTSASQRLAKNADLKARVFSLIKDDVEEESFNSFFPSIYLSDSSKQQVLCTKVRQEIDNDVFCPDAFGFARVNQFVTSVGDSGNGTNPTYEAATTFQTVLWMSIIMFLFVLGAIYSIGGIAMEVVVDPWLQVRDTKEHQQ